MTTKRSTGSGAARALLPKDYVEKLEQVRSDLGELAQTIRESNLPTFERLRKLEATQEKVAALLATVRTALDHLTTERTSK